MTVASFQTGALLTLVLPVTVLLLVGCWWAWAVRRRRQL
jgi:hypothetical protein